MEKNGNINTKIYDTENCKNICNCKSSQNNNTCENIVTEKTKELNGIVKNDKPKTTYRCIYCDFNTSKKTDYMRHINTKKHKTAKKTNDIENLNVCECGKAYKNGSGLWKHRKKCEITTNNNNDKMIEKFCNVFMEMIKNVQPNNENSH